VTTPSVSSVEVIGDAFDDVGLNVHFENDAVPDAWFALQLVTLVDHAVGSHATVGDRSFVETADGAWVPTTPAGEVVGPIPVEAGWPMAPCQGCQPGCAVQRLHRHGGNGGTSIQAGAYGGSGRGRPGGDGVQQWRLGRRERCGVHDLFDRREADDGKLDDLECCAYDDLHRSGDHNDHAPRW
jgi:hypothetical protein